MHFIYKSRQNVQVTSPVWDGAYEDEANRNRSVTLLAATDSRDISDPSRVLTLYQQLHDSVHARSGQSSPLKLVYVKTDHEACLAWVSSSP